MTRLELTQAFRTPTLGEGDTSLLPPSLFRVVSMHVHKKRVLILGTGPLAWKIAQAIHASSSPSSTIVGFVRDEKEDDRPGKTAVPLSQPILGSLKDLDHIVKQVTPDRIIVALTERRGRMPVRDLLHLRTNGIPIEDGIEIYERYTGKLAIESLNPSYLIFSRDFERPKWTMALRRILSLSVAAVGLGVFAPLLAIISLAIRLDSKGPVFFIQERIGRRGCPFRLLKFRTMHPAPPRPANGDVSVWHRADADRITRVGKWLRRFYLDEVPQFINILKGDMDLVGPRPEMAENVKTMTEQIPYYFLRSMVRPGLTGWAQVRNGYAVGQEEVMEKTRYDLYYIKRMSPLFDLRILVATVKTVLRAAGGHGGS